MFIVNQDRNTTINMGNVKEISLQGKQIFADDTVIGKYGTEERTDQVYKDIFNPYICVCIDKYIWIDNVFIIPMWCI